jgi:hypothetical protein
VIRVSVDSDAAGTASLTLKKGRHVVARSHSAIRAGKNVLRLHAPRGTHGRYVLVITVKVTGRAPVTVRRTVRFGSRPLID